MTPHTRIYLVRHGEVAGAGVPRYNGQTDVALSERGQEQYQVLGERLATASIAACYASDLSRCTWGAQRLAERFGVSLSVQPDLRELNIGIWEGMAWAEIQRQYPEMWLARLADLVNYRPPQGENLLDVHARVMPVIAGIVDRHRGEEVLVVAHGGVNRIILLEAIGAPLGALFSIEQTYGCLNIIDYYADGRAVVKLLNG